MGYVSHEYDPKSLYQRIGLFFIGVGPIIFGSGVLFLLLLILVHPAFESMTAAMQMLGGAYDISEYFAAIGSGFGEFFVTMFSAECISTWTWWVMLVLGCLISLHMRLSSADVDGAKLGLLLVIAVFALVPIVIGLISYDTMLTVTGAMTSAAVHVMCVYALAIMFAAISTLIAFVIHLIVSLFGMIFHRG